MRSLKTEESMLRKLLMAIDTDVTQVTAQISDVEIERILGFGRDRFNLFVAGLSPGTQRYLAFQAMARSVALRGLRSNLEAQAKPTNQISNEQATER